MGYSNKEIFESFVNMYEDLKGLERAYEDDKVAVRMDFVFYVDSLRRSDDISSDQYVNLDIGDYLNNDWEEFNQCESCGEYKNEELETHEGMDYCENCLEEEKKALQDEDS